MAKMTKASEVPALAKVLKDTKPLTPIQERLLSMPLDTESVLYQHSALCQTSMPYRNPGDDIRVWRRRNGDVRFELQAGSVFDPVKDDWMDVGLPFGPKPRIVLFHLNAEALRKQSAVIELEDSLTAFVRRTLGLDPKGRNIKIVKDQLTRLAAADFRIGVKDQGITIKGTVIQGFELWDAKDSAQRLLWPTTVRFSADYFKSLMTHAVPLDEGAISRLSHTAMGLDCYTWLAQRLHRVDPGKPGFVPWVSLKEQFGQGYDRMNNFKQDFRTTLGHVKAVYRDARIQLDDGGMRLRNSPPPVSRRVVQIK